MRALLALLLLCAACTADDLPPESPGGPGEVVPCEGVDHTESFPDSPDVYQVASPVLQIPANSEILWCFFGAYEGPDAGVVDVQMQSSAEGLMHHAVLHRYDGERADGALIDCTDLQDQLALGPPLFEISNTSDNSWFDLPEGFAYKLSQGQRWAADVHYINLTDEPICINVAWDLDLVDADEVETFVGAYNLDVADFEVPPGQHTRAFECAWPQDVTLLSISGHMHFHGDSFAVDWLGRDRVYAVEEWEDEYRFSSPVTTFEPGELAVPEGAVFRSACTWDNGGASTLRFPEEMCTTYGIAYPLDAPLLCADGEWIDGAPGDPDGDPPGQGEGTIFGTVGLDVTPIEDGVGDLRLAVFDGPPGPDSQALAAVDVYGAEPAAGPVPYVIEGVPEGEGRVVLAFLDDDGGGLIQGPTAGDLLAISQPVTVGAEVPVEVDLLLGPAPGR